MLDYAERDETWRRGVLKLSLRAGPTKLSAVSFSRSVESTTVFMALINAHSVVNKKFILNDYYVTYGLDFLLSLKLV